MRRTAPDMTSARSISCGSIAPATVCGRCTGSCPASWTGSLSGRLHCRWRRSVLLFWERAQKAVPEGTDAQADVVVTFCRSLLEAGVQFTIAWNDATEQRCVSQQIRSMDELIGLLPRLLSAREDEGLSGAELFLRSSGEAVLSHILYITGRVPEQAYLLGQFGRLTVLSCGASGDGAICFDCEHYAEQLAELEI